MMCQENGRRHAEIVRRLVDDDDSGICGDEYLKIDTGSITIIFTTWYVTMIIR